MNQEDYNSIKDTETHWLVYQKHGAIKFTEDGGIAITNVEKYKELENQMKEFSDKERKRKYAIKMQNKSYE